MNERFRATRDPETNAIYVYLTDNETQIARTVHVTDIIMIDLDNDGNPIGVEIL